MKRTILCLFLLFALTIAFKAIAVPERVIAVSPSPISTPAIARGQGLALAVPTPTPEQVRQYVIAQAEAVGVNPKRADWIVGHESQYGVNMRGDDGQSRGYWMISKVWHPEVSDACADNLACSTAWSLREILHQNPGESKWGGLSEWSTWKYCRKWYLNCPF